MTEKYHIGDARKLERLLRGEQLIDVTITSPPYWNLKDYGVKTQIGFGQTYEEYLRDLEKVFRAVFSHTKETGSLWIISDTVKHRGQLRLLPFDLDRRLRRMGWTLQDIIIWNKDRTLPWSHQGKLRNIFEYITFYSKKGSRNFKYYLSRARGIDELREWWVRYPERYSPEGKAPARIWWIPIPRQGSWGRNWVRHFNPLPPRLVKRILLLTTDKGDVVLDPFSGSGAVLAQAHVMGRKYIGLDLNREFKRMFKRQVLPAIRDMHEQTKKDALRNSHKKRQFGKVIRSLRITKFPKEVVRLYRKMHPRTRIGAVLALGNGERRLRVIFLFEQGSKIPTDFLADVQALSKRPPLSKFGIEPAFEALHISRPWMKHQRELGLDGTEALYAYVKGRTYAWSERLNPSYLLETMQSLSNRKGAPRDYPPIISNIGIRLEPRSVASKLGDKGNGG